MEKRVSIYIDGANFVYGLKTLNPGYSDYHFDFDNFIKRITGKCELVSIFYYNASLKQEINPRRFQEQQKLRDKGDEEAQRYDKDFVEALEHGMPPTCGFGVSERLFSFLMD